jgi:aminopeptidase N
MSSMRPAFATSAVLTGLLVAAVLGLATPSSALTPPTTPVHDPFTRDDWEGKQLSPDKGPEHGDAAATSDRYDVRRYDLDLRVDPNDTTLVGIVGVTFASRREGLASVVLDLANRGLTVSAVQDGLGARPFVHAGDSLTVTLRAPLALGAVDSLLVSYAGVPRSPLSDRGLFWRNHFHYNEVTGQNVNGGRIIASMSQPAYCKYWWPCKDRPDDKADTVRIAVTVPDTMVVASNGLLMSEAPADLGWKTYTWLSTYPLASYLVSVAISNYEFWQEECATTLGTTIPLVNYVFPLDRAEAEFDLARVCEMLEACEGWFGPYPFAREKYGHAEFVWGGAMEHQTCCSLGSGFIDGEGTAHSIIVHELAHQWYGDSLTPRDWADIWLNEGFATYAEALWAEREGGAGGYDYYMSRIREPRDWVGDSPVYDPVPVFPGWVIYRKGAWILHMLRDRVGDDVFFPLLDEWTNGGGRPLGTVITDEFIELASAYAGEDLGPFMWPYLTTDAVPVIAMTQAVADGPRGPQTRLTLDLRQMQSPLFDNVYPVRVITDGPDTTLHVRLAAGSTTTTFDLPGAIENVLLDPDRRVIWQAGTLGELNQLQVVYPNPAQDDRATLRFRLDAPARVVVAIYDARGALVHRDDVTVAPDGDYGIYAWNCRRDGARVASGVYWATVEIAGERSVRKFTVLR